MSRPRRVACHHLGKAAAREILEEPGLHIHQVGPGSGPAADAGMGDLPAVAVAVVTAELGVLLVARRDGVPPWSFPGGAIEPGESAEQAAVREVREELGLAVTGRGVLGERMHPRTGRRLVYVAAELDADVAAVRVVDVAALSAARWASLAEARALLPDLFGPVAAYLSARLSGG